jgi:DNA-binding NtrC family response regulator
MRPVILVVDDEPEVRGIAALVLERANFTVLVAGGAAEALSLSRSTVTIDLLITDVDIGNGSVNGIELASIIQTERPGIPAIIMSGTHENEGLAAKPGLTFLKKPFSPEILAGSVRRLLPNVVCFKFDPPISD